MKSTNAVTKQMNFYENLYYICSTMKIPMKDTLKKLIGYILECQINDYYYDRIDSCMKAVYYTNVIKYCKLGQNLDFVADLDEDTIELMESEKAFEVIYEQIMIIFNSDIIDGFCSGLQTFKDDHHEIIDNVEKIRCMCEMSFVNDRSILDAMNISDKISTKVGYGVPRYDTLYSIIKGTPKLIYDCINEINDINDTEMLVKSILLDINLLIEYAYYSSYGAKLKMIYRAIDVEDVISSRIESVFSDFENNFEKLMSLFNVRNRIFALNSIQLCNGYDIKTNDLKIAIDDVRCKRFDNDIDALIDAAYKTKLIDIGKLERFSRLMYSKIRFMEIIGSQYRRFHDGFVTYFIRDYAEPNGFIFKPILDDEKIKEKIPDDFITRCVDMYWLHPLNLAIGCSDIEHGFKTKLETPLIELNLVFDLLDEYSVKMNKEDLSDTEN